MLSEADAAQQYPDGAEKVEGSLEVRDVPSTDDERAAMSTVDLPSTVSIASRATIAPVSSRPPIELLPPWLHGLPRGAARVVIREGLASLEEVRDVINAGALTPWNCPGLGQKTMVELCAWCGAAVPAKPKQTRGPSALAIQRAKETLERAGYVVLPPKGLDRAASVWPAPRPQRAAARLIVERGLTWCDREGITR